MSAKENIPPSTSKRSKIPIPKFFRRPGTSRGIKRDVSPSAPSSDMKRSPTTTTQRPVLGELPTEQRKIVKSRRRLSTKLDAKKKGKTDNKGNVGKSSQAKIRETGKLFGPKIQPGVVEVALEEDVEFETDAASLASILDETGIPDPPRPQTNLRHTLAATPRARASTVGLPGRVQANVNQFIKSCNEYLDRTTQPSKKRQRKEDTGTGSFNTQLTPSKTDFCSKFGVSKDVLFKQEPLTMGRQSVLFKPKTSLVGNPFTVPGRLSSLADTPMRVPRQSKASFTPYECTHNPFSVMPGRLSSLADTPMRVPRQSKASATPASECTHNPFSVMPGRFSLAAQTPGRVKKLNTDAPFLQSGRVSLAAQSLQQSATDVSSTLPGRVSLSVQNPEKHMQSVSERDETKEGNVFQTLTCYTPQHVPRCVSGQTDFLPGRQSLISQTPQRVAGGQHFPEPGRFSLAAQTPSRVPKKLSERTAGVGTEKQKLGMDIVDTGRQSLAAQTPGRVPRKGKTVAVSKDPQTDEESLQTKPVVTKIIPLEIPQTSVVIHSDTAEPANQMANLQNGIDTPNNVVTSKPPVAAGTPSRVARQQGPAGSGTPRQAFTPSSFFRRETLRHLYIGTPVTPPSRVKRKPEKDVCTPGRVPKSENSARKEHQESQGVSNLFKKDTDLDEKGNIENDSEVPMETLRVGSKTPTGVTSGKGNNMDIRNYWKTKKTPNKSPVLKEIFTVEESRKKLTWAETLEKCCKQESQRQDDVTSHDNPKIENHDEMQDSSSQEKGSPSPSDTSHDLIEATTQNSSNMQLPLIVLAASSAVETAFENGNKLKQSLDLPGTMASGVSQQSQPSDSPDSESLSQQQWGQERDATSTNKTQNELLQEQIKLFKEKQLQLAKLVRGQMLNAAQANLDNFNNTSVDASLQTLDNAGVTNTEYIKQAGNRKSAGATQGVQFSDRDLDVNSNMTVKSTNTGNRLEISHDSPVLHGDYTSDFTTPKKQNNSSVESEATLTPFILRNSATNSQVQDMPSTSYQCYDSVSLSNVACCQTPEQFSTGGHASCPKSKEESEANPVTIAPPIMTPMAMKTVAQQQKGEVDKAIYLKEQYKQKDWCENVPERDCENVSDRQVLSDISRQSLEVSRGLKTPPSTKKQSAFRKLGQSGLTPFVGSLSLRANLNQESTSNVDKGSAGLLKSHILHKANERYLEALLDNEVELYACRLVMEHTTCTTIRCYDPVAKTLMEGDDMHFIPIDEEDCVTASDMYIQGSAFTKVFAIRST